MLILLKALYYFNGILIIIIESEINLLVGVAFFRSIVSLAPPKETIVHC